jgi:ParB family chromosome partitioning protein
MTSGGFHSVFIGQITVPPRQREDLGDIDQLAKSIRRLGVLIHPIVIDRDHVLVAGERRLLACKQLGWDRIDCHYIDELDEFKRAAIELEENIKRKQLDSREERKAVVKHHQRRCAHDPDWNETKTADEIGMSQQWVSERLVVHEEGKLDSKILDQPVFSTALRIANTNRKHREEAAEEAARNAFGFKKGERSVINADFCEWVKTYKGPRFNFLHCDFPYGINTHKRHQGNSVAVHGDYDDSPETYWRLLGVLCENLNRLCTESAHIMFWFSMQHYADTLDFFHNHSDFEINEYPLIWVKSDGKSLVPDPERQPRRVYETCLFGSRGDRKILTPVQNACYLPTDRDQHMSTKPEPVLRHFFRMIVDSTSSVLDPTCGSGTALRAAESLGAANVQGIEINKDFADRANLRLEKSRRAPEPVNAIAVG